MYSPVSEARAFAPVRSDNPCDSTSGVLCANELIDFAAIKTSCNVMAFTYPTEVRYFAKRLKYEGGTLDMLADVTVACIGPITAETAQSYSLSVTPVPQSHTYAGLVNQIIESVTG